MQDLPQMVGRSQRVRYIQLLLASMEVESLEQLARLVLQTMTMADSPLLVASAWAEP